MYSNHLLPRTHTHLEQFKQQTTYIWPWYLFSSISTFICTYRGFQLKLEIVGGKIYLLYICFSLSTLSGCVLCVIQMVFTTNKVRICNRMERGNREGKNKQTKKNRVGLRLSLFLRIMQDGNIIIIHFTDRWRPLFY